MSFAQKLLDQLASDEQALTALREAGDNAALPRVVEHFFTSPVEKNVGTLGHLLEEMAIGELELHEDAGKGGEPTYRLEVRIESPATWTEITRLSILMKCLSAVYQVTYDGWGSPVAR